MSIEQNIALVFPGQGSQKVGMGKGWAEASPEARRTYEEADEVLGFPLSRLCWEGPEDELNLTVNTQPALLATSVAIHRSLAGMGADITPLAVAGHSLGEYSALVAAGALGFADALRLVRRRGQLMQEAVPVGQGAMAAIIGLDDEASAAIAAEASEGTGEVCVVANYNSPGQVVLAGHKGAIDRAVELARERGARKATLLAVSAPFHSPLMRPAREVMEGELATVPFRDPRVPVVTNIDAAPVASGDAARAALVRQIDGPVRWVESVRWMRESAGPVLPGDGAGQRALRAGAPDRAGTRVRGLAEPEQLRKVLAGGESK